MRISKRPQKEDQEWSTKLNSCNCNEDKSSDTLLEWFLIPPYRKCESWEIKNCYGEFVALFECEDEARLTVQLHNEYIKNKQP